MNTITRLEYITNCIDRILMARCAPSQFRRRSRAIARAIQVAHEEGMNAAHNDLRAVLAEAEASGFANTPLCALQAVPKTDRLRDICRCGHTLERHDYGAAFEKPCLTDCDCRDYRKAPDAKEKEEEK